MAARAASNAAAEGLGLAGGGGDAPVYAAQERARRRGLLAACLGGLWDVVHFRDCVWVNLLPDAVPVESS